MSKMSDLDIESQEETTRERDGWQRHGAGTTNKVAIECGRNAIGIELQKEYYDLAIEKRFSRWDNSIFDSDDSIEKMKERFTEQLEIGKKQSEAAKTEGVK